MEDKPLRIGKHTFTSRLFVGTGKYETFPLMAEALEASGTEVVTVAVRRVNLSGEGESLLDHVDREKYTILPNTAGCFTADDAIRTAFTTDSIEREEHDTIEMYDWISARRGGGAEPYRWAKE